MAEFREVYDSVNKDRLLGRWYYPPALRCERLSVAIAPPLRPLDLQPRSPCQTIDVRHVEFRLGRKHSADGYDLIGCLLTSAPLEDLLRIKGFALPGETLREAEERAHPLYRL